MTRPVKVLICGSHRPAKVDPAKACNWLRVNLINVLSQHFGEPVSIALIVEGGADGADRGGLLYASMTGAAHRQFKADWTTFGNRAGPLRNREQFWATLPDIVVAFSGDTGTADMISVADAAHCPVYRVEGEFGR